nr:cytochrome c oxidase subunit 3 [Ophiostoma piliferum]
MFKQIRSYFKDHPFHLVDPSPWPILTCCSLLGLTANGALSLHSFDYAYIFTIFSLFSLVISMSFWFRDIIAESTFLGEHTLAVRWGINFGILLFIVSEALFFLSIFWAFFHASLSPTLEIGGIWPPLGVEAIDPFELPLLNTVLLLSSGVTLTLSHHSFISGNRDIAIWACICTLVFSVFFTFFQYLEYDLAPFTLSDGTFGSVFFFGTGFHGLHVIIGSLFLGVSLWRLLYYHLTQQHHVGFEGGIAYWHFVDVVWLFLFISFYYWGS